MILDDIVERKKIRLNKVNLNRYNDVEKDNYLDNKFVKELKNNDFTIIGEFKRASPSKGVIAESFQIKDILRCYEDMPISAYSVLTEEDYFLGCNEYLKEISK